MILTPTERWKSLYPHAAVGALVIHAPLNPTGSPAFAQARRALEAELRERFAGCSRIDLNALPPIRAYTAYYKRFDKTYHVLLQLESVALKGKQIPGATALVEAMFAAELKNLLLTAGHDLDALQGPLRLDAAVGGESYEGLNGRPQALKAEDMFLADEAGIISSILYGPDRRTMITPQTRRALYTVYAPSGIPTEIDPRPPGRYRRSHSFSCAGGRTEIYRRDKRLSHSR